MTMVCMLREWLGCSERLLKATVAMMKTVRRRHGDDHVVYRMLQRIDEYNQSSRTRYCVLLPRARCIKNYKLMRALQQQATSQCQAAFIWSAISKLRRQIRVRVVVMSPPKRPFASRQLVPRLANAKVHDFRHHSLHYMNIAMAPLMFCIMRMQSQSLFPICASCSKSIEHG
jgi:hypothetical protein